MRESLHRERRSMALGLEVHTHFSLSVDGRNWRSEQISLLSYFDL